MIWVLCVVTQVEAEQLKAVNRVLEKDVERLETERRVLKQRLLDQAMDRAEQTVRAGGAWACTRRVRGRVLNVVVGVGPLNVQALVCTTV